MQPSQLISTPPETYPQPPIYPPHDQPSSSPWTSDSNVYATGSDTCCDVTPTSYGHLGSFVSGRETSTLPALESPWNEPSSVVGCGLPGQEATSPIHPPVHAYNQSRVSSFPRQPALEPLRPDLDMPKNTRGTVRRVNFADASKELQGGSLCFGNVRKATFSRNLQIAFDTVMVVLPRKGNEGYINLSKRNNNSLMCGFRLVPEVDVAGQRVYLQRAYGLRRPVDAFGVSLTARTVNSRSMPPHLFQDSTDRKGHTLVPRLRLDPQASDPYGVKPTLPAQHLVDSLYLEEHQGSDSGSHRTVRLPRLKFSRATEFNGEKNKSGNHQERFVVVTSLEALVEGDWIAVAQAVSPEFVVTGRSEGTGRAKHASTSTSSAKRGRESFSESDPDTEGSIARPTARRRS